MAVELPVSNTRMTFAESKARLVEIMDQVPASVNMAELNREAWKLVAIESDGLSPTEAQHMRTTRLIHLIEDLIDNQ